MPAQIAADRRRHLGQPRQPLHIARHGDGELSEQLHALLTLELPTRRHQIAGMGGEAVLDRGFGRGLLGGRARQGVAHARQDRVAPLTAGSCPATGS